MHRSSLQSDLSELANFVMVAWRNDTFIKPKVGKMYYTLVLCNSYDLLQISSHFGYYEAGQSDKVKRLEATAIFKEDWISLQDLYNSSRLHFLNMSGDHMDFDADWFRENIVKRFLIEY